MTESKIEKQPPTEAQALMEIAKAIRELPAENMSAQRQAQLQPKGSMAWYTARLAELSDPSIEREHRRARVEDERAKRAEQRASIAIAIATLGAMGSMLAAILH